MGYDLHIHRADDWLDAHEVPISREEWEAVVAELPDLEFDEGTTASFDDGTRQWTETAVVWTTYPGTQINTFWYDEGSIVVKNPDEHYVRKMVETAGRLAARVQGDDGEFYGVDGRPID
jgi:hypothetical protein